MNGLRGGILVQLSNGAHGREGYSPRTTQHWVSPSRRCGANQLIAGLYYALTDRCLLTGKFRYGRALEDFRDDGNAWSEFARARIHGCTGRRVGPLRHFGARPPLLGRLVRPQMLLMTPLTPGVLAVSALKTTYHTQQASGLSRRITSRQ